MPVVHRLDKLDCICEPAMIATLLPAIAAHEMSAAGGEYRWPLHGSSEMREIAVHQIRLHIGLRVSTQVRIREVIVTGRLTRTIY